MQKIAVVVFTGITLLTATPAMAGDMYGKMGGAEAWSRGANGQVAVKDNSADGDETYAPYHRRTSVVPATTTSSATRAAPARPSTATTTRPTTCVR
ncbi:hypothetical protein [Streptomyces sudanensis]|uniref:Uncharacterized protein n=1 Tax=Streptomyces sudanensis TaxID=436397 RepID=A0ABY4TAY6_9ACTN|nr:hypothetical protein [Streptomyces sudanensis]URN15566.1 hypothetical protein MW084_05920 [Streptomyces sudanensis]